MHQRRPTGRPWKTAVIVLAALAMVWASDASPAAAEARRALGFHFFAEGLGVELQRESQAGSAWLAGITLAPVGFYGAIRQYESGAAADRTFWTVYGTISARDGRSGSQLVPGVWASAGYEVRLDRSAWGSGEVGFGLVGSGDGLEPRIFIGLSLSWKLPR